MEAQTVTIQTKQDIAALIDHTLLKPEANWDVIRRLCAEAAEAKFASVCVNPYWVAHAVRELDGSGVKVCTVIGFPLGATTAAAKLAEAEEALADGARELDMVLNIGALRSGQDTTVEKDIGGLAGLAHDRGALLKVIFETCLLTDDEKRRACHLATAAGADFVKTSTGFLTGGATVADVQLMRENVGANVRVKASGGIRSLPTLIEMVKAGATRIGTSSGVAILREFEGRAATAGAGEPGSY